MSTAAAKEAHRLRKRFVEPVFGIIKEQQGARRFLLRGLANVAAEWTLFGHCLQPARSLSSVELLRILQPSASRPEALSSLVN